MIRQIAGAELRPDQTVGMYHAFHAGKTKLGGSFMKYQGVEELRFAAE
jgi:hypothetical protein